MPYQPVIDLVTRALDRVSAAALRNLAPVSLAELAALVPEVGERFPDLPQLSNDFPEARQARLSRAVDQLLEASRDGRPAVLMVDDIQWADDASAQVLHYLARHAAQRPVLVIYAYRDEAVDSDERLRTADRELAPRHRRAPCAARPTGLCRYREPGRGARRCEPRRTRPGRAPASRNRRQSVLPDVDPAVPERGRDAAGTTRERRTGIAPGRVACRRARATRARAQSDPAAARNRRGPRPALRLRYPARRNTRARGAAARRGGGARQAPFAARGTRGRRIRLQPRQAARGGLSRHRRGAAQTAASVGG